MKVTLLSLLVMVGLKSPMQKTWVFNCSQIQDKKTLETSWDMKKKVIFLFFSVNTSKSLPGTSSIKALGLKAGSLRKKE